jgi:hypothetical protein
MAVADVLALKTTSNPSRNGTRTMESLTLKNETVEIKADEAAELQALIELSAHDLALVGGGAANVAFV